MYCGDHTSVCILCVSATVFRSEFEYHSIVSVHLFRGKFPFCFLWRKIRIGNVIWFPAANRLSESNTGHCPKQKTNQGADANSFATALEIFIRMDVCFSFLTRHESEESGRPLNQSISAGANIKFPKTEEPQRALTQPICP